MQIESVRQVYRTNYEALKDSWSDIWVVKWLSFNSLTISMKVQCHTRTKHRKYASTVQVADWLDGEYRPLHENPNLSIFCHLLSFHYFQVRKTPFFFCGRNKVISKICRMLALLYLSTAVGKVHFVSYHRQERILSEIKHTKVGELVVRSNY